MISIVEDIYKLKKINKDIVLTEVKDYVSGYQKVLDALEQNKDLKIYIQERMLIPWFKNMAARYSDEYFKFTTMNMKTELEEKWSIKIPVYITNEDIIEAELNDLEISPKTGDLFENVILEYFYSASFTPNRFLPNKLVEILTVYDKDKWDNNVKIKSINKIFHNKFNEWRNKSKDTDLNKLISLIENEPLKLKENLTKYKVLRTYKKIGKNLLGEYFKVFESVKPDLNDLVFNEKEHPGVIENVKYYLNELATPETEKELSSYANRLSGLLSLEFNYLEKIFKEHPNLINNSILAQIEVIFKEIYNRISKRIKILKSLIKPPFPSIPEKEWGFNKMIDWAINSYLPYYTWADENNSVDLGLSKISEIYSEWLFHNWEDIRANTKRLVFNIISNYYNELKDSGHINLFIIIDNFSYRYCNLLIEAFLDFGFSANLYEPYISMIPSETEISKKCLLSGKSSYIDIDNTKYEKIVNDGWLPFLESRDFIYLHDIELLLKLNKIEKQTYFINYLPIDNAQHKEPRITGFSKHSEHIKVLLSNLIKSIFEFIGKFNIKDKVKIHIASDHGSTRISKTIKNDIDLNNFKKYFPKINSHRYFAISDKKYNELNENLKHDCFFIDKNIFRNDKNYICAKRYNRFIHTENKYYVHGGLSPEETIVPYIQFQQISISISDLKLSLIKTIYRYRLEKVEFEIANPNEYPVENISIEITNSNIQAEKYIIEYLDKKRKMSYTMQGRFLKTKNKEDSSRIGFNISFKCNGKQYTCENIYHPIVMKTMAEVKDKTIFDEIF